MSRVEHESACTSSLMTYEVHDLSQTEARAHHAGDLALLQAAMNELSLINPNHPLLMPDVAKSIYELGATTFRERGWGAAVKLVADPRAVLAEHQLDFEGRRQRLLDAVGSSPVEVSSQRYFLLFRRRVATWRGRTYPTDHAAQAAKRSEIKRLRRAVLGDQLETRPSNLTPAPNMAPTSAPRRAHA